MCNKGITQFHLLPTHVLSLHLFPSRKALPPFGWYSLRLPTKGWPGWVDLGGWLHIEILNWTRTQSPIPVLTGPDVGNFVDRDQRATTTSDHHRQIAPVKTCSSGDVLFHLLRLASAGVYMYYRPSATRSIARDRCPCSDVNGHSPHMPTPAQSAFTDDIL